MPADTKVLNQALKLHQSGKSMKEILEVTELTYSQAWLFIEDAELDEKLRIPEKQRTAQKVKQLRDQGYSWGKIQVLFGYTEYTEGKIRAMYEEATGIKSAGLRVGRGGRFLNRDPRFYAGDRKHPGVELAVGTRRADLDEIAQKLDPNGVKRSGPGTAAPVKKAVAKKAAKATKKAVAKKATKRPAPKTDVDPFDE